MKKQILSLTLVLAFALAACQPGERGTTPEVPQATRTEEPLVATGTPTDIPYPVEASPSAAAIASGKLILPVATDLEVPWAIAFLPGGELLLTERPGRLVRMGKDGAVTEVEGVRHVSEGGLLGLAIDPAFEQNRWIYLYLTSNEGLDLVNRVERYYYDGQRLTERQVILEGINGAMIHDGGRIAFGPDDKLYITTGDAGNDSSAQDLESLNGKILRINSDGSIPSDNPFGNTVWSYGHRNPQGLAWDDQGRLWSTEHGPSGIGSGFDELNLIFPGDNYGWPDIKGDETAEGMINPVLHSGADDTWAPADLVFADGRLYFGGLRGVTLYAVSVKEEGVGALERYFVNEYGRIRALAIAPNGRLYMGTSNRDGRGRPNEGDDHVFSINLALLTE